jgi:hypothetical protein
MTRLDVFGDARHRTIDEARILEMLLVHGWRFEVAASRRAESLAAARAALERCVALGLPYRRSADGARLFDPDEMWNFVKWAQLRHGEGPWEERCVSSARRDAGQWEPAGADPNRPPALDGLGPRRFAVTIRRTFNLAGRRPGERIRLRLPLPLEDAALSEVSVEFLPPAGLAVETAAAPARLDVLLAAPDDLQVGIGVRTAFTARPLRPTPAASLDAAQSALYTRPSEGLIKVSARVRDLAAEIAGAERDPLAILHRFWDYILDTLAGGAIHHDALDPARPLDWVLDHGWYDCQAGSALLAALCRARRIPARLVTGYMLHVTMPAFHTWMEAWVDGQGWLPFDLECWELSVGGRDAAWRDLYFGQIDYRMVVERPPRLFGGLGAVRLPPAWQMLTRQNARGGTVEFEDLDSGTLVYREDIEVEQLDAAGS